MLCLNVGEKYGYFDRIVRIGTHKSDGRLKNRLKDHFQKRIKMAVYLEKI